DHDTGFVVGSAGLVLGTTNGGQSWTSIFSGTSNDLTGISFTIGGIGIIVGKAGTILKTTNGGQSWFALCSGTSSDLRGVSLPNSMVGIAVGSSGTILRTTNGGTTWTLQYSSPSLDLIAVAFVDTNVGVAVGTGGTVLRTNNGGVVSVEEPRDEPHPMTIRLEQNYPNPFNSSTNIQFRIHNTAHVNLKVFNILGQEIATLVDEEVSAGVHSASWSSGKASSGVYIYRMQTGNIILSQKMVLLK
ncbi:MAG: YCF48-related protein, partial [Pseudomonadota bacterium]